MTPLAIITCVLVVILLGLAVFIAVQVTQNKNQPPSVSSPVSEPPTSLTRQAELLDSDLKQHVVALDYLKWRNDEIGQQALIKAHVNDDELVESLPHRVFDLHGRMAHRHLLSSNERDSSYVGHAQGHWSSCALSTYTQLPRVYNPAMSGCHSFMLARADAAYDTMGRPWDYFWCETGDLDKLHYQTWSSVQFQGVNMARTRDEITNDKCVVEDLRWVVYKNHNNNRDDLLLTGSLYFLDRTSIGVFTWHRSMPGVLKLVKEIVSPHRQVEKNWLFVQKFEENDRFLVFYSWNVIYEYNHIDKTLRPTSTPQIRIPCEWQQIMIRESTPLRMSAACYTSDDEIMILYHTKSSNLLYSYYCLWLDAKTLQCTRYIPTLVCTDVGFRICFVMSVLATCDSVMISMGIQDMIGGVMCYDRQQWEDITKTYVSSSEANENEYRLLYISEPDSTRTCFHEDTTGARLDATQVITHPIVGHIRTRVTSSQNNHTLIVMACATELGDDRAWRCYPFQTPEYRHVQYARCLMRWLRETTFDILVLDGTGRFALEGNRRLNFTHDSSLTDEEANRISFCIYTETKARRSTLSSTPLEAFSMHMLQEHLHSKLNQYKRIVKVTGKYFSRDIERLMQSSQHHKSDIVTQTHEPGTQHVSCELFAMRRDLFTEFYAAVPTTKVPHEHSLETHLGTFLKAKAHCCHSILPPIVNEMLPLRGDCSIINTI